MSHAEREERWRRERLCAVCCALYKLIYVKTTITLSISCRETQKKMSCLVFLFCIAKERSIQLERYSDREMFLLARESYHSLVEVFKVVCAVADVVFVHFIFKP